MHSSLVLAILAAGAFAQPLQERAMVVETKTVVMTQVVTAGSAPAAPTGGEDLSGWQPVNPAPAAAPAPKKHGHAHAHLHAGSAGSDASMQGGFDTSGSNAYQNLVLTHHNIHRANHSAPAVTWDSGLEAAAQEIANSCVFEHKMGVNGLNYGQNIAAGVSADNVGDAITGMFYNNEMPYFTYYGEANPGGNFAQYGHFTALVWKGTNKVACATAPCSGGVSGAEGTTGFTVCNYGPPGNMEGDYGSNIGSPLGHPTIQGSYGKGQV